MHTRYSLSIYRRKYPIATCKRLIDRYGKGVKCGYDIRCDLHKTLHKSSLADLIKAKDFSIIVPSFHGHSHNRKCQISWHPLYNKGVGKEDFEGCERCFAESNALASSTRLATPFHRHQTINDWLSYWAELKHTEAGLSVFLEFS